MEDEDEHVRDSAYYALEASELRFGRPFCLGFALAEALSHGALRCASRRWSVASGRMTSARMTPSSPRRGLLLFHLFFRITFLPYFSSLSKLSNL